MTKNEQSLQKLVEQQEKLIDQLLLQQPAVYYPYPFHHCRPQPYWDQWTVTSTTTNITNDILSVT